MEDGPRGRSPKYLEIAYIREEAFKYLSLNCMHLLLKMPYYQHCLNSRKLENNWETLLHQKVLLFSNFFSTIPDGRADGRTGRWWRKQN